MDGNNDRSIKFCSKNVYASPIVHSPNRNIAMVDNMVLLQPPDFAAPLNLINTLSDDVLGEIFKKLDTRDLCATANVCTRFRPLALKCFQRLRANETMAIGNGTAFNSLPTIETCMRTFGPYIKTLSLQLDRQHTHIVPALMATHCTVLSKLYIHCCNDGWPITNQPPMRIPASVLQQLIQRLRFLSIDPMCMVYEGSPIAYECRQLESLEIHGKCQQTLTFYMNIPSLRNLRAEGVSIPKRIFKRWILSHRQLKHVRFANISICRSAEAARLISYLHAVQTLQFVECTSFFYCAQFYHFSYWNKFSRLKHFSILGDIHFPLKWALERFLEGNVPLEFIECELQLLNNVTIGQLCKFKTLNAIAVNAQVYSDYYSNYYYHCIGRLCDQLKTFRLRFFDLTIAWVKSCLLQISSLSEMTMHIDADIIDHVNAEDCATISSILADRPKVEFMLCIYADTEDVSGQLFSIIFYLVIITMQDFINTTISLIDVRAYTCVCYGCSSFQNSHPTCSACRHGSDMPMKGHE